MNQLTELQDEITFLNVCENFESTSRQLLQCYLERMTDHQTPLHLAHPQTFWTIAHNQSQSIKYFFFRELFTSSRIIHCFTFSHPIIYSQFKVFENNLHLSCPWPLYKEPHQSQNDRHGCLFQLVLLLVV